MGRGKAFVEVLDDKLDGYESHATGPISVPIATMSYFPPLYAMGGVVAARCAHAEPPRPPRKLSMKQQEALDALIGLGARLDTEFTQDELRAAFRMLALRYHPDRHVSSSDAEKAHLALLFARAHNAYERLKVVEPAILH